MEQEAITLLDYLNFYINTKMGQWLVRTIVITIVCGAVSVQAHNMGLKRAAHGYAQFAGLALSVFCSYVYRFDKYDDAGKTLTQVIEKPIETVFWEGIIFWLIAFILLYGFELYIKPRIGPWLDKKFAKKRKK